MNTAPQKVEASDFSHKEYNVTPFMASLFCTKVMFVLEPEYAVTDTSNCCGNNKVVLLMVRWP
jgi:hypothetical protein